MKKRKLIRQFKLDSWYMNIILTILLVLIILMLQNTVLKNLYNILLTLLYIIWVLIVEIPIHESLHKIGFEIFNIEAEVNLKYNWRNKLWRIGASNYDSKQKHPCCKPKRETYLTFKEMTIISMYPLLISAVWLLIYAITGISFLKIPVILSLCTCIGDIMYVLMGFYTVMTNLDKKIIFEDRGEILNAYEV